MKKILSVTTCAAIIGVAGTASAYMFDLGAASTVTGDAFSEPGLVMEYSLNTNLDNLSFDLDVGQTSSEFLFAKFFTNESWINKDDKDAQSLTANVDFDIPDSIFGIDGTSNGTKAGYRGRTQGWEISWDSPQTFSYGNGGSFLLSLSDASFEKGFWLGPDGYDCGSRVFATITNLANPVPEPGTMLLMGFGLAGLIGYNRKRSTQKA